MVTDEYKQSLVDFIDYCGYDLSFHYNYPGRYRIEVIGQNVKFVYAETNAIYRFWIVGEELYNRYLRRNKIKTLVEKING